MPSGSSCHEDLIVWSKSVELASEVYAASRQLPRDERFGLRVQLRRSALAVSSHIALASASRPRTELVQQLRLARGSLLELQTQALIAARAAMLSDEAALLRRISEVDGLLLRAIERFANPALAAHAKACNTTVGCVTADRPPPTHRTRT